MKKTEKNAILNAETIATYYCGNVWQSLEIKPFEYGCGGDFTVYVFTDADGTKSVHRAVIQETAAGDMFFYCYPLRRRVYFRDVFRVHFA